MPSQDIDAIELLEEQHREVEQLFEDLEQESSPERKQALFQELADMLAVHATIEERHFYPTVRDEKTEKLLLESVEEHLAVKRLIADLLKAEPEEPSFAAKVKVLKEEIEHHVEEEESELFPQARRLLGPEQLLAIAPELVSTQVELEEGPAPREAIPGQTREAAPIG